MINWVFDLCSNMPSFILVIFLLVLMMLVDKNKCIFIAKAFVTIAQLLTDFIRALIQMICNVCKRRNIKFCSESHVHSDEHSPVEVQLSNLRNDIDEIKHIVSPHADSMPIQRRVSHAQNYVGRSSTIPHNQPLMNLSSRSAAWHPYKTPARILTESEAEDELYENSMYYDYHHEYATPHHKVKRHIQFDEASFHSSTSSPPVFGSTASEDQGSELTPTLASCSRMLSLAGTPSAPVIVTEEDLDAEARLASRRRNKFTQRNAYTPSTGQSTGLALSSGGIGSIAQPISFGDHLGEEADQSSSYYPEYSDRDWQELTHRDDADMFAQIRDCSLYGDNSSEGSWSVSSEDDSSTYSYSCENDLYIVSECDSNN